MNGSGMLMIGNMLFIILILMNVQMKNVSVSEFVSSWLNSVVFCVVMQSLCVISVMYSVSSMSLLVSFYFFENIVKMKLVCFFGMNLRCVCVFFRQFLLSMLFELIVIMVWIVWKFLLSGLDVGLSSVYIWCFWQLCISGYCILGWQMCFLNIVIELIVIMFVMSIGMISLNDRLVRQIMKKLVVNMSRFVLRFGCFVISLIGISRILNVVMKLYQCSLFLWCWQYYVSISGVVILRILDGWIMMLMFSQCFVFFLVILNSVMVISSVILNVQSGIVKCISVVGGMLVIIYISMNVSRMLCNWFLMWFGMLIDVLYSVMMLMYSSRNMMRVSGWLKFVNICLILLSQVCLLNCMFFFVNEWCWCLLFLWGLLYDGCCFVVW